MMKRNSNQCVYTSEEWGFRNVMFCCLITGEENARPSGKEQGGSSKDTREI